MYTHKVIVNLETFIVISKIIWYECVSTKDPSLKRFSGIQEKKIIPFQPTKTGMEGKENYISKLCNYGGMALSF